MKANRGDVEELHLSAMCIAKALHFISDNTGLLRSCDPPPLIYLHRHLPAPEHRVQMETYRALQPSLEPLSTPMFHAVCYTFCNSPRRTRNTHPHWSTHRFAKQLKEKRFKWQTSPSFLAFFQIVTLNRLLRSWLMPATLNTPPPHYHGFKKSLFQWFMEPVTAIAKNKKFWEKQLLEWFESPFPAGKLSPVILGKQEVLLQKSKLAEHVSDWFFFPFSKLCSHSFLSSPTNPDSETQTRQENSAIPTYQTRALIKMSCDAVWICL